MNKRQSVLIICAIFACLTAVGVTGGMLRRAEAKPIYFRQDLPTPPGAMGLGTKSDQTTQIDPSTKFDLSKLPTSETSRRSGLQNFPTQPAYSGQLTESRTTTASPTGGFVPAAATPTQPTLPTQPTQILGLPGPITEGSNVVDPATLNPFNQDLNSPAVNSPAILPSPRETTPAFGSAPIISGQGMIPGPITSPEMGPLPGPINQPVAPLYSSPAPAIPSALSLIHI